LDATLVGGPVSVDSKGVRKMGGDVAEVWIVKLPRHICPHNTRKFTECQMIIG
jgi:hypothetical protein